MRIKFFFLSVVFLNVFADIGHKIILQNIIIKNYDGFELIILMAFINALIILPFILLFTPSGFLSDRYLKNRIIQYGAGIAFVIASLMSISYCHGLFNVALVLLFLLAIQSAVYSPAKFSYVLHLYGKENLSLGNALVQSLSIIAILASMSIFSFSFEALYSNQHLDDGEVLKLMLPLSFVFIASTFIELVMSLFLPNNTIENTNISFSFKNYIKLRSLYNNVKEISQNKIILLSVLALSLFWGLSQGLLAVYPVFMKENLGIINVGVINSILASSGLGIGVGSLVYSRYSKHYIEVGTIPLASFMIAFMIYLSLQLTNIYALVAVFFTFGFFGAMLIVPLNALIQFHAEEKKIGTILAGNNWFQSVFMLSILIFTTFSALTKLSAEYILYTFFALAIVGAIYTLYKLPQSMVRFFISRIIQHRYTLGVNGIENIPSNGGVLLLGNHTSWLDWAILQMASPREIKFVMERSIYEKWYLRRFLDFFNVIPISSTGGKGAIELIAKELDKGSVVALFPEGSITYTGYVGEFKKGFEKILEQVDNDISVIPFFIKGLWESKFSRASKTFKQRYKKSSDVNVSFGKKIEKEYCNTDNVRQKVLILSIKAWKQYIENFNTIPEEIVKTSKKKGSKLLVADSSGLELSGNKFLMLSILFKGLFSKTIKKQNVGILLPASAMGAVTNNSIFMLGKTAVNINYTADLKSTEKGLESASVEDIITSSKFIDKLKSKGFPIELLLENKNVIFLEDLKPKISKLKAIMVLFSVSIMSSGIIKFLWVKKVKISDPLLILFSSGSEDTPKGIVLSHKNILGNIKQISHVFDIQDQDVMMGTLPLFHAFGITVTTLFPLVEGLVMVAHPDPTDAYGLGKLVAKYDGTVLCGTSTFMRLYTKNKKLEPLMFESIRLVIAGAERLDNKVRLEFKEKFSLDIYEGYGATETSPVSTVNMPNKLTNDCKVQTAFKIQTTGMPLPGTAIKIVDPDSFKELKVNEAGMILIGGIQVMHGYLNNAEKTKEVLVEIDDNTWYISGDKGKLDEDGFLVIIDRYSRFVKLGGEMISLSVVESKITKLLSELYPSNDIDVFAVNIPDEKKGEQIILLLSSEEPIFIDVIQKNIRENLDNKLFVPSRYLQVKEMPKLGSGKKDFKGAKKLASNAVII
jgi:acyl-[acyl-carrier-protein]-phospholipid O-acyltransferase/long-chain-fatty-acid--[acyl-carrier-protein] ligase